MIEFILENINHIASIAAAQGVVLTVMFWSHRNLYLEIKETRKEIKSLNHRIDHLHGVLMTFLTSNISK